jgi:hypothetical protein
VHAALEFSVDRAYEFVSGQERMIRTDKDCQILGHPNCLDDIDADFFQGLGKLNGWKPPYRRSSDAPSNTSRSMGAPHLRFPAAFRAARIPGRAVRDDHTEFFRAACFTTRLEA